MRIVMILSCFYPLVGGGERQAQQLAARLIMRTADQGSSGEDELHPIDPIDLCVVTRRYPSLARFECVDGIRVYRVPIVGQGRIQALTFTLGALRLLARLSVRDAILHCHQSSLGVAPITIAALAKRVWGCRVIVKFMGSNVVEMLGTHTWPVRRWLLCQADAFVVTNEGTGRALGNMGLDVPTHCLPNGVDVQRFRPTEPGARPGLRKRLGLPSESPVVLYVGRLERVKGVDVLLHAWARLIGREAGCTPVLVLVGDGLERKHLVRLSHDLGIASSVRFVGLSEEVRDWLNAADLFVLPSRSEGLSNALLEAMASGLPAVATAVGGAPDLIREGVNGLLVPGEDDVALADALLQIVRDPSSAEQLGKAARQTILTRYSMEAVVDRYVELYAGLSGEGPDVQRSARTGFL